MTNIADCLARAVDDGQIDRARAAVITADFQQMVDRYRTIMPEAQAIARANADIKTANKAKTARRRHQVLNQMRVMRKLRNDILTSRDPAAAIRAILEYSEGTGYKGESVRSMAESYRDKINSNIHAALQAMGPDVLGRSRNGKVMLDTIRELHGEPTGNTQARALAEVIRNEEHAMVRAFNSFGGDVPILKDRGVAHSHDASKLIKAKFDTWAADIETKLAWDKITDFTTGKPFAAKAGDMPDLATRRRFLDDVYKGITTRGWDDRNPSLTIGGRALANQRLEHRVLHFASGTAWLDYNAKYGLGDPYSAMIGGLHALANDVALMRVLGPNPRMGLNFAEQVAMERSAQIGGDGMGKLQEKIRRQAKLARTMLAHQDGSANVAEHLAFANFMSGTRAVLTSAQLGSAVVSSVTDFGTVALAASQLGMSATNVLARTTKMMFSKMDREDAARAGYIMDTVAQTVVDHSRFAGSDFATGLPQRLANFTLRITGLNFLTDLHRVSFQMSISADLAGSAKNTFDQLRPELRKMFSDRGITAADWDMMRAPETRFIARDGADFITPMYWLEHQTKLPRAEAEGLAMRWQAAIREQVEYAVPNATLEGRARVQGNAPPGSLAGEFLSSGMQYKAYPLALTLAQWRRTSEATSWGRTKYGYATKMSVVLLGLGALSLQLNELRKGNDPRPMTDAKFWIAALFKGGGLGIFGDFFAASENRIGGGFGQTLMGPVAGLATDIGQATAGNALRAFKGEDVNLGRDAMNFASRYTPFLSSAWFISAAYNRLVAEELPAFFDPEAEIAARRRLQKQARDYGTQPFIPRLGGSDEFRLPDFSNMFEVQP